MSTTQTRAGAAPPPNRGSITRVGTGDMPPTPDTVGCHVGVVGYHPPDNFDAIEARRLIRLAFDEAYRYHYDDGIVIVAFLTTTGMSSLAFEEANNRGWSTMGIGCEHDLNQQLPDVDETVISGHEWGDEAPTFLAAIDILVRIGGGRWSHWYVQQTEQAGKPVLEYELASW